MSAGTRWGRAGFPEVAIRTDAEGRYCLNDLHKAAGDLPKDQPAKYFANQQAKDLISEIGDHSVHVVRGYGKEQGTYVCKELVYAYAMWISPAFSLKVIRAYDAIVRGDFGSEYLPAILHEIDQRLSIRLVDLEAAIETRIHGELAKQRTGIRHGVTAGQVWHEHGFPADAGGFAGVVAVVGRHYKAVTMAGEALKSVQGMRFGSIRSPSRTAKPTVMYGESWAF